MKIIYSHHAEEKFHVLARHGIHVDRVMVERTINNPDRVDYSRTPLLIAQTQLDSTHVLRVVYKQNDSNIFVITFYPGRAIQYGK